MKDLRKIKEQIDLNSQDGKVLESMRPIMQDKAMHYQTNALKNKKSLIMTLCIICIAMIMLIACFVPTILQATKSKEFIIDGKLSVIGERISFQKKFGDSGENGVYYFDKNLVSDAKLHEIMYYERLNPENVVYTQRYETKTGHEVFSMTVRHSMFYDMSYYESSKDEAIKAQNHKDIKYYCFKEDIIEGVMFIFTYGNYVYNVGYQSKTVDMQYITPLMDKLLQLP